eukprot:m.137478 g.137478  ORF g.137478 m.137478 type:complete len:297 (-) comp14899_c0_seq5:37-927(-)
MSLCSLRLKEAAASGPATERQGFALDNAEFICELLRQNPTVLALPELVLGAETMELEVFKDVGEYLELGPIHIAHLYEALQLLSKQTRAKVASLGLYGCTIADRDVKLLLEIVALFPNLKELDLGHTHLLIPDIGDVLLLLEKLTVLRVEDTEFAGILGEYYFDLLSQKQVKKIIFLSRQDLEPRIFDFLVPERLHKLVLDTHEAFFARTNRVCLPLRCCALLCFDETTSENEDRSHFQPLEDNWPVLHVPTETAAVPQPSTEPSATGKVSTLSDKNHSTAVAGAQQQLAACSLVN